MSSDGLASGTTSDGASDAGLTSVTLSSSAFDSWIHSIAIFMRQQYVTGHCMTAVQHAWPHLYTRLSAIQMDPLWVCLSICLSVCLCVCLSVCFSVCLYVSLSMSCNLRSFVLSSVVMFFVFALHVILWISNTLQHKLKSLEKYFFRICINTYQYHFIGHFVWHGIDFCIFWNDLLFCIFCIVIITSNQILLYCGQTYFSN